MSINNNYFVLLSVIYNLQSFKIVSIDLESDNPNQITLGDCLDSR